MSKHKYYLLHKPYLMLSQFTREVPEHICLSDLAFNFPKDVYPVGRLDRDSEGLLILTNDQSLNQKLLNPTNKHERTYLAQVEGVPTATALQKLCEGVDIKINKKRHHTLPAKVKALTKPPKVSERNPPIRFRKNAPTTWLQISLIEGKNRQVRKMCAAVGHPVLRLIRKNIETLDGLRLAPGEVQVIEKEMLFRKLNLK